MQKNPKNLSKFNPFSFCVLFLTALLILSACTSQPQECVCVCDCSSDETAEEQAAADSAESENTDAVIPEETAEETGGFVPCPIAFDSDRDGNREIYVMDSNGENLVKITNDPADDWNPDWSPDGSQIAFVSKRNNEQGSERSIYIMNADGSNLYQLNTMPESDLPDWSPDGTAIAFTSNANGNFEIYIMNADGSNEPTNLTNSDAQDIMPIWSPDGRQIAWLSGDLGNKNVFVMDADGNNVHQLTDQGSVYNIKWSIDGNIYIDWENNVYGSFNCLMDPDGTIISTGFGKGDGMQYFPFWTLEGDMVELVSADMDAGNDELYLIGDIFPDNILNITNNPGNDDNPDWPMFQCGPQ